MIVYFADGRWRYATTGRFLRLGSNPDDPPCTLCGRGPTTEGHDACLGHVEEVRGACCGHGVHAGYLKFADEPIVSLPRIAIDDLDADGQHPIRAGS